MPAHLLWRDVDRVSRFRAVDEVEQLALRSFLSDRQDFAIVCERLARIRAANEVPALALGLLRQWFDEGLIVSAASQDASRST